VFLKSLVSETVRKSADGESCMTLGRRKRRSALRTWSAAEVWCSWPSPRERGPRRVTQYSNMATFKIFLLLINSWTFQ